MNESLKAIEHARKYLGPQWAGPEDRQKSIAEAASLLAFQQRHVSGNGRETVDFSSRKHTSFLAHQKQKWYSHTRWEELADLFTDTHNQLFSLPAQPSLLIALSAGLSALKTPSCHSKHTSSTANASSTSTSVCPICSTELNEVARKLPYAHHTKSYVEDDAVVLPNGRVYGSERLHAMNAKFGVDPEHVRDPTTLEVFPRVQARKVYIT